MADDDNVVRVQFGAPYPVEDEMKRRLDEVVYSYSGKISMVSAVGILHTIAQDLMGQRYGDE